MDATMVAARTAANTATTAPMEAGTVSQNSAEIPFRAPSPAGRISPAPRRILIKAVNWLGDLVMSIPAMRAVRRAFPDAHLAVLVKQDLAGFFDGAAWLDEVIAYAVARGIRGLGDRRRIVAEIRSRRFDLAILMPNSFDSALWVLAAGVPRRAGFIADLRGPMLTHKASLTRDAREGHQVNQWLAMIRETLGIRGDAADFAIAAHEPHLARMREWLAAKRRPAGVPLVTMAPAAAYGPAKEWPAEKFAALIDRLAQRSGAQCVLAGAPSERARCEQVAALSRAGAIVAAGETGIGELIALLSLSNAFVGNDSGAMHLAGALGIPAVAVFGSTNPLRTGPLGPRTRVIWHRIECSPCLARTCRFGHYNCLGQVEPEEVLDALASLDAF